MPARPLLWALAEALALAALAPPLLFPGGWRTLALLGVPLWWLVRRIVRGHFVTRTPLDWPVLILLIQVLVSMWATADVAWSLPKISGLILGIATFYAVVEVGGTGEGDSGLAAAASGLVIGGVGLAFVGALGTRWPGRLAALEFVTARLPIAIRGLPGADSGFNIHELGGALLWCVPPIIFLFGWSLSRRCRLAGRWRIPLVLGLGAASFATAGILVLTQSRGSWIGLAAGLGVTLLTQGRRGLILGLLLVAVCVGALGFIGPQQASEWIFGAGGADFVAVAASLEGRMEIWSRALYGIADFPFTGMGMNMFRRVVPILYPLFRGSPDQDIAHAHNEYLQAALDLGIPGLIAFLAIYLSVGWMLVSVIRRTGQSVETLSTAPGADVGFHRALGVGLLGGLAAHAAYGLTDAVALGAKPAFIFWLLLGLASGLYARTSRGEQA